MTDADALRISLLWGHVLSEARRVRAASEDKTNPVALRAQLQYQAKMLETACGYLNRAQHPRKKR